MVHSSCLSPALGNSLLSPAAPDAAARQPLHLSPSVADTHDDGDAPEGGVISHFVHSLTALLGVLQGEARRLAEPAVMHDGAWWGGVGWREGGGCSFWWHQLLLTPAQRPLCHKEIMINRPFSLLAPLRWRRDVFSFQVKPLKSDESRISRLRLSLFWSLEIETHEVHLALFHSCPAVVNPQWCALLYFSWLLNRT